MTNKLTPERITVIRRRCTTCLCDYYVDELELSNAGDSTECKHCRCERAHGVFKLKVETIHVDYAAEGEDDHTRVVELQNPLARAFFAGAHRTPGFCPQCKTEPCEKFGLQHEVRKLLQPPRDVVSDSKQKRFDSLPSLDGRRLNGSARMWEEGAAPARGGSDHYAPEEREHGGR